MNRPRKVGIPRAPGAGAARLLAQVVACLAAAIGPTGIAAAEHRCPDLVVGEADLDDVLDQTLGSLRAMVDQRAVSIDPQNAACPVHIVLSTSALSQYSASCRLEGCSAVVARPKSLALREFDVAGCDALFNVFGLSRHLPSTYVDASRRIRQHCGSDDFEIDSVTAVRVAGQPKLRIGFRAAGAPR
jgi:hypothetical protein